MPSGWATSTVEQTRCCTTGSREGRPRAASGTVARVGAKITWPGVLEPIAHQCGDNAASVIALVHGGHDVYVPKRQPSLSDSSRTHPFIGLAPLEGHIDWLIDEFGGITIYVPMAIYQRACLMLLKCESVQVISSRLNISVRTANRYRQRAKAAGILA